MVNLVLDASSGTAMQEIVVQITASSQAAAGDTATGEKTIRTYHWNLCTGLTNVVSFFVCVQLFALVCD